MADFFAKKQPSRGAEKTAQRLPDGFPERRFYESAPIALGRYLFYGGKNLPLFYGGEVFPF